MNLNQYKKNYFSQYGEDGILKNLLSKIRNKKFWACEFGAWDGVTLMNTRKLILEGYSCVLIESDNKKFQELYKNYSKNKKVFCLNRRVGFDPSNSLDSLLSQSPIPKDFDLLSIDIDGNEYHIWSDLKNYKPKIVCVEFNPTIPTEVEFIQKREMNVKHGSSLKSLAKLARKKIIF